VARGEDRGDRGSLRTTRTVNALRKGLGWRVRGGVSGRPRLFAGYDHDEPIRQREEAHVERIPVEEGQATRGDRGSRMTRS